MRPRRGFWKRESACRFCQRGGVILDDFIQHLILSAERVKKQVYLSDDQSQRVLFAKATLRAKINNQIVLLRRYSRNRQEVNLNDEILHMSMCEKKIERVSEIDEIMGYERTAAKYYFQGLSKLVDREFQFSGRSKRPPRGSIWLSSCLLMETVYRSLRLKQG